MMIMKIWDGGGGDDNVNNNCGRGDDSDDGLFGFWGSSSYLPKRNDALYPAFLLRNPNHFTHTHRHTNTRTQTMSHQS